MLQIGKYYLQRNGVVVGPLKAYTGRMNKDGFAFCCDAEGIAQRAWREDGSFMLDKNDKHHCDLISEVQLTPLQQPKEEIMSKEFKLEAGKYYKDRDGEVHGPMKPRRSDLYPFEDGNGDTYTENGVYVLGEERGIDLIKEVPDPYEIKPEEIVKITDADLRPTIEEVLSAIQRGDEVIAEDEVGNFYNIYSNNSISLLLDAKSFEIKVKQPVVKYKYVFQEKDGLEIRVSGGYFVDENDFLDGDSKNDFEFFEPIIATRKEF